MDNLLVLLEVLPDLSPVLLLVLLPLIEVVSWLWALNDLGILFFRFVHLLGVDLFLLHYLMFRLRDNAHCGEVLYVFQHFRGNLKEMFHILLLELIFLDLDPLVEPLRISNLGNWVHTILKSCRDCNDLLDGTSKSLLVVIPIEDAS